jgi:hypothetical protein
MFHRFQRVVVTNESFSVAEICFGPTYQLQHVRNVWWSQMSVLAWLEYFLVKNVNLALQLKTAHKRTQNTRFVWAILESFEHEKCP